MRVCVHVCLLYLFPLRLCLCVCFEDCAGVYKSVLVFMCIQKPVSLCSGACMCVLHMYEPTGRI